MRNRGDVCRGDWSFFAGAGQRHVVARRKMKSIERTSQVSSAGVAVEGRRTWSAAACAIDVSSVVG